MRRTCANYELGGGGGSGVAKRWSPAAPRSIQLQVCRRHSENVVVPPPPHGRTVHLRPRNMTEPWRVWASRGTRRARLVCACCAAPPYVLGQAACRELHGWGSRSRQRPERTQLRTSPGGGAQFGGKPCQQWERWARTCATSSPIGVKVARTPWLRSLARKDRDVSRDHGVSGKTRTLDVVDLS